MNRRNFLIGMTAASLASLLTLNPPLSLQARAAGQMFQGTADGRILISGDGGDTWQPLANFGPHLSVVELFADGGSLYARLGFEGYTFLLQSSDGKTWRTLPA
jgi:hypothetical protein